MAAAAASGNMQTPSKTGDFLVVTVTTHAVMMLATIPIAPGIMLYRIVWKGLRPKPLRISAGRQFVYRETR